MIIHPCCALLPCDFLDQSPNLKPQAFYQHKCFVAHKICSFFSPFSVFLNFPEVLLCFKTKAIKIIPVASEPKISRGSVPWGRKKHQDSERRK